MDPELPITKVQSTVCSICEDASSKPEATGYCFQCSLPMCQTCMDRHDIRYPEHVHVHVNSYRMSNLLCKDHKKYIGSFCIDCMTVVCQMCIVGKHVEHAICNFTVNADANCDGDDDHDDHDTDQSLFKVMLNEKRKSAEQALNELEIFENQFNEDIDKNIEELDEVFEKIKKEHENLKSELLERKNEVGKELKKSRQNINKAKRLVNKLQEYQHTCMKPLPDAREAKLAGIEKNISPSFVSLNKLYLKKFIAYSTRQPLGFIEDVAERAKLLYVTDEVKSLTGLCYIADGSLVVSTYSCSNFTVYNEKGKKLAHILCDKCRSQVTGLATNPTKSILVAVSDTSLWRYNQDGLNWHKQNIDVSETPTAVAVVSGAEVVWGCNSSRIKMHKVKQTNITPSYGSVRPQSAVLVCFERFATSFAYNSMCVDSSSRIIVCHDKKIGIYTKYGEELLSFTAPHIELSPSAACLDSKDNIYVSDKQNNVVLEFDKQGQFIKTVLEEAHMTGFISLYNDQYLALSVGQDGSDSKSVIHIYKL